MSNAEILVLTGSPGSGKSTMAEAIADILREAGVAHAVVDVDELARTFPEQNGSFKWKNLRAILPNYDAIPHVKLILPVLINAAENLKDLSAAARAKKLTVCELTAPEAILKERITLREPNKYWQDKLHALVDDYAKTNKGELADFKVNTQNKSKSYIANEIINQLGWVQQA